MATCASAETAAIAAWSNPINRQKLKIPKLLNEVDLDSFFAALQKSFQELRQSRFYILVDDVSYGHIHLELQKILNSFLRSSQSHHCFKITCDRYMYTLETSDGRTLTAGVEGTHVDLAEVSAKTSRGGQVPFSKYMAAVVDRRLRYAGYKSDVIKLFGASQPVKEFLTALALPRKRSQGEKSIKGSPARPKALYAGWNIISNISHGSVRTLLELLEYVFNVNDVVTKTETISLQDQDDAVRSYSKRRYRSLAMLPGETNSQPLGDALQNVIAAIGEVSRRYLQNFDTGEVGRWYETITVERLDRRSLDPRAEVILTKLIEFNLFIDEGITFSRAQFGLSQRYDMNKIFSPAFETTYRVRNHMYLSHRQFTTLLLRPDEFVAKHRKKLDKLVLKKREIIESDLFENSENAKETNN
jgi:hypothetical protein